jgi:hypothetical protein
MISANDTIVRDPAALFSALDDQLIMIDIESGKYLTIDAIGTDIWQAIEQPIVVETLVERLMDRYAAPRERIREDALAFLNNLATRGFVRLASG